MNRTIRTALIAGTALGFGGVAAGQGSSTISLSEAYRAEIAADAAARVSNLDNGRSGFRIAAADGVGTLNVGGLFQFRYTASFRDEDAADVDTAGATIDNNDFAHGFSIPRARLDFFGTALIPNFTYRFSADFNSGVRTPNGVGSTSGLDDFSVTYAYGEYAFEGALEGLSVRFGSFKLPLFYEELVAPEYQLAAERSITNEFFSQQYSEGVQFTYALPSWKFTAAVSDGLGTAGTSAFTSAFESDIALTGRVDWKIAGDWAQFDDFTSFRGSEYAARLGSAIHWEFFGDTAPAGAARTTETFASTIPGNADGTIIRYTFDGQFEGNGWNLYGAFYGSYEESTSPAVSGFTNGDANDFGVVAQAGYFVTDQVEVFARYEGLFIDDERFDTGAGGFTGEENLHFGTFGFNYYFVPESHALKFTADVIIAFEETSLLLGGFPGVGGSSAGTSFSGFLPGSTGSGANQIGLLGQDEDTEVAVRAQLQFLF